jgi:hypothetical protein
MAEEIKAIGRLLDEGTAGAATPAGEAAKSRLAASFAEALRGSLPAGASPSESTMAAFLDGRLGEAELDQVTAALARDERLRAELESGAALVDSVAAGPRAVPQDLLARAQVQFAPEACPERAARGERAIVSVLSVLWPGRTKAWAMAAFVLLVLLLGSGVFLTGSRLSTEFPHEQLNSAPSPDVNDVQVQHPSCEDRAAETASREAADRNENPPAPKTAVPSNEENPCPPAADETGRDSERGPDK